MSYYSVLTNYGRRLTQNVWWTVLEENALNINKTSRLYYSIVRGENAVPKPSGTDLYKA